MKKAPLARKLLVQKGAASDDFIARIEKEGVQITSNASRAALTSMLETGKIGVWKTPERLDTMRFSPYGI